MASLHWCRGREPLTQRQISKNPRLPVNRGFFVEPRPPKRAALTKGKNMKANYRRVRADFAPAARFEIQPVPPALFRAVQEAQFAQLKNQLLREHLEAAADPKLSRDVSLAASEAAALAWVT